MITRGLRDFVNRDWALARRSKDLYWGDRIARLGSIEGWRIAEALRQQVLAGDRSWPHADARQADLQTHVRIAESLRRACPTRRR